VINSLGRDGSRNSRISFRDSFSAEQPNENVIRIYLNLLDAFSRAVFRVRSFISVDWRNVHSDPRECHRVYPRVPCPPRDIVPLDRHETRPPRYPSRRSPANYEPATRSERASGCLVPPTSIAIEPMVYQSTYTRIEARRRCKIADDWSESSTIGGRLRNMCWTLQCATEYYRVKSILSTKGATFPLKVRRQVRGYTTR